MEEAPLDAPIGLTSTEAAALLLTWGTNAIPEERVSLARRFTSSLWQPVPWMLEATIILEFVIGEHLEAGIIALLLAFNSILSLVHEYRSGRALEILKQRLAPTASTLRDGTWTSLPSAKLVPGDIVRLSLGGIVPADVIVLEGAVLVDQSMLTGESLAVESVQGTVGYAGALIRRGEALARVTATGGRTYFGRTAELVRIAHAESSEQKAVLSVVRNISVVNGGILAAVVGYAHLLGLPTDSLIKLALTAMLASIPVALPATFTLAAALAAQALARRGVLPTHLAAVHEAAAVDTLCSDKTGTLTRNELAVSSVMPGDGVDRGELLSLAALASSEGGGDPLDAAIQFAAAAEGTNVNRYRRLSFIPFDPAAKQASATVETTGQQRLEIAKGAFATLSQTATPSPELVAAADAMERRGERVLAVTVSAKDEGTRLVGLIGVNDPPRDDARALIAELEHLGIRTIMVTGDSPLTAAAVATAVGLKGPAITSTGLRGDLRPQDVAVVAGVLPEHKYQLVQTFQRQGHVVGMCGDGANDAPALRQAQFGVAVSTATDVAKSAASLVLTEPGLSGIVTAIREGRKVHQRVLSYALNAIIKKIEIVPLLAIGLVMNRQPLLTPLLMIVLLVTGDFLTMALTTDNVRPSLRPSGWNVRRVSLNALGLGLVKLAFTSGIVIIGGRVLGLDTAQLQTLAFVTLVFGSQAVVYVVRERNWFWSTRPSRWLILASVIDITIAAILALGGIFSAPLPLMAVVVVAICSLVFTVVLDAAKRLLCARIPLE